MKNAMKNCAVCGAEIAAKAKTCPHCGAKNKKKPIVLWVIIAILAIAVIGSMGGSDEPAKVGEVSNESVQPEVKQEQTVFVVGDQVDLSDILVTFNAVEESDGSSFFRPTDGNVFVVCDFTVENNSSQEITVSSMLSFEAYVDDYATSMNLSAMLFDDSKKQLDGTVAPGKKITGVIGYEVPSDWKELEVRFTPDFWAQKDITFVATK